ncbi:DUF6090 family protein [Aequorivita antarctica]|uniref:DUF6090 family protein n=1 Tax=Aequorivita antarctica TaxID=153266 RepID=UPI000DBBEBF3|nr:DUF6090 family protein [Aequorivita antarctica]SRX74472.1 hypothetical protein AEQU3_01451 [Aequorivita antarctica]
MIKLFRNIRKNLLKEGKTTNYLKYAIGEIILVVIGILIALQINNWNENNKLEKEAYKVLLQMQDEFSRNQNELKIKIEQHKFVKESFNELSTLVSLHPKEIEPSTLDSLMFSIIYIPEFNALNSISSSEKLALVDDTLKNYIADWKLNYDYYKYSIKLIDDDLTQFTPFLYENYQLKNLISNLIEPSKSAFDSDRQKILSSPIFENHLTIRNLNAGFVLKRANALYKIQNEILQYINVKLKNENH